MLSGQKERIAYAIKPYNYNLLSFCKKRINLYSTWSIEWFNVSYSSLSVAAITVANKKTLRKNGPEIKTHLNHAFFKKHSVIFVVSTQSNIEMM